MQQAGTRPEIEIYDVGQLYNLRQLVKDGVLEPPFNLQFVLGVLGGTAVEPDQLIHLVRTAERIFGIDGFTFSAAGVGYPGQFQMAAMSLMLGGNIRVGLEDNLRVRRTDAAKSNGETGAQSGRAGVIVRQDTRHPHRGQKIPAPQGQQQSDLLKPFYFSSVPVIFNTLRCLMDEQYDVAIVGYGPVGQTLATLLGRAGHRVAVIEKWPTFYPMPRAVHFDHEVARILQNIGLRPDQSTAIEPYDAMYAWRNASREDLMLLDWTGVGPTGWHTANFFAQPVFEPQLDQLAKNQPTVSIHRGWEVVAVEEGVDAASDSAVTLVLEGSDGVRRNGERRELTASYVVGADGANIFIRCAMGSPMHDLGFFFDWLIVDLILTEPRVFDPPAWQLCDPARPTTIVPGGPGRRRWEFLRLPDEDIKDLNRMERAWELLEPWDVHPGNATVERHTVYTFQAKWAETWRRGRLRSPGTPPT